MHLHMLMTLFNLIDLLRRRLRAGNAASLMALLAFGVPSVNAATAFDGYVGHLGGVAVNIPRAYGRFLEYDGDPNFMERRKGAALPRDYRSAIRGFAFEAHYPDMAVLDIRNPDATPREDLSTSRWLRVLVWANSDFTVDSDTYMDRVTKEIRMTGADPYREEPELVYGLRSFSNITGDERHVRVWGEKRYLEVGKDGKTLTHITCKVSVYTSSSCAMTFVLDPAMHAKIRVSFRKGLLEDWREIKASVTKIMLGFAVANRSGT
ncbi:hypothetical protein [Cupriavidus plantarum]|uniref:Uncharacterized protein n=1 Tax=Cupriavidus plantarum TaxID=942865 RepID=A0A316F237_9BURK|nr:hypothetical protein [Cupriavidus plantarum]PWK37788.1 hypothetical protein C7419_1011674 [Cupriavidus plantarum]